MQLLAQRPQGMGTNFHDAVMVGADLVGVSNTGGTGHDGQISRSTDKGDSFSLLYTVSTANDALYAVAANGNVVIASGTDSVFYRAADFSGSPTTWTVINPRSPTFGDVVDLAAHENTWIAAGAELIRSADNGLTWAISSPSGMDGMQAISYSADDSSWIAVGGGFFDGSAWRSTDDGLTWTEIGLPPNTPVLKSVAVDGFGNVLAVGKSGTVLELSADGLIFTTADLGTLSVSEDLQAVVSTGEGQWLLAGDQRQLIQLNGIGATQILDGSGLASPGDTQDLILVDDAVVMAGIEKVPAPQISVSATFSFVPIEVTLIEDVGVDGTYYTEDGNAPDNSPSSNHYSAPFLVSEDLTLTAVSEKNGVYSTLVSETFTITIHTLSILANGSNMDLTLDTSVVGYEYQLKSNPDLTNAGGWLDEGAAKTGTGNPLLWTSVNPVSPHNWRVEINPTTP